MSTALRTSPLLKIFGFVGAGLILVVSLNMFTSGKQEVSPVKTVTVVEVPSGNDNSADQDTVGESLANLNQQLADLRSKNTSLQEELAKVKRETPVEVGNEVSMDEIERMLEKKIQEEGLKLAGASRDMNVNKPVEEALNVTGDLNIDTSDEDDIELDDYSIDDDHSGDGDSSEMVWIGAGSENEVGAGVLDGLFEKASELSIGAENRINPEDRSKAVIQYATVDKEAILYDAVVLTELIGVTASSTSVKSPFRFKVELSNENVSTSGIYLPHLAEMRMSGYAVGEWSKSCVQGVITSATFVFDDGTITNLGGSTGGDNSNGGNQSQIGYLADPYGSPCIVGKKYSDLMEYASITGSLSFLGSVGDYASSTQFSSTSNASGDVNQTFDGDVAVASLGGGLSEGMGAINKVIAERYAGVRDLIVAPPGISVDIHLTKQLNIDYDPKGRKVINHDFEQQRQEYYEKQVLSNQSNNSKY